MTRKKFIVKVELATVITAKSEEIAKEVAMIRYKSLETTIYQIEVEEKA